MLKKVLLSTVLIAGTITVIVVLGLAAYVLLWLTLIALFAWSRLSGRAVVFSDWSWSRFVVTLGCSFGIVYGLLLLTAGF